MVGAWRSHGPAQPVEGGGDRAPGLSSPDRGAAVDEHLGAEELEIRKVQPYQARKAYLCPGCNQDITEGLSHLVVVPRAAPELRRHWHHPCWAHRRQRRPGRG